MLRFTCEGTVLKHWVTIAKGLDVGEGLKLEMLRFWGRYSLLTGSKVVLRQKPVYNVMRGTINASGIYTLVFVPSCDKVNNQSHFLQILSSVVLS